MEWTVFGITYEGSSDWFSAWSGWAQAVSAAIAIWAAGRLAAKDVLDRRVQSMDAFHGIARQVPSLIRVALEELATSVEFADLGIPNIERFADIEEMLKAVPVFDLGANRGADMVNELLHVVRTARTLLENRHVLSGAPEWLIKVLVLEAQAADLLCTVTRWRAGRDSRARRWLIPYKLG